MYLDGTALVLETGDENSATGIAEGDSIALIFNIISARGDWSTGILAGFKAIWSSNAFT